MMTPKPRLHLAAFLLWSSLPFAAAAQMFSVTETPRAVSMDLTSFTVGLEPMDFTLKGEINQQEPDFSFSGPVYRIKYDADAVNVRMGFSSGLGSYGGTLFTVGASLLNPFTIAGNRTFQFQALLGFETDFMRMRRGTSNQELVYSTGSIGLGPRIRFQPFQTMIFTAGVVRTAGFLSRNYGLDNGRLLTWQVPVQLHLQQLVGHRGITVGLIFRSADYDSRSTRLDYDAVSTMFTAGINF